jgi:hypothetical protein
VGVVVGYRYFAGGVVAADSRGRIVVLDRVTGVVRVFEEKQNREGSHR